jgi:superfamily II DNA or RNA helicase
VLLAGAGATKWKQAFTLEAMVAADKSLGARIVLSTMQTASTDLFIKAFRDGSDLLVVADEVHQIGSTNNSKALQIPADKRLGLSATPIRFGDPEGTQRIFEYFGPVVPPAISLSDAVKMDRLVPYLYYPHPISLTAEEADEWSVSTAQIRKEFAKSKRNEQGQPVISDRVKMLLINRSRIAKKASSKVQLASQVVYDQYEDGQSWLVYCEDSDQLTQVLDSLRTMGLSPIEYHSNMVGDREATLQWFRKFGGVLVSIKCLDEGVDIPAVSHALILASSQNPRQFIQRRGRVLRKDDGKNMAVIHDAIVVPLENENESDQMSLLTSELARAVEFADNAINRDASAELRDIAMTLQLDLDEVLAERGFENDDQA